MAKLKFNALHEIDFSKRDTVKVGHNRVVKRVEADNGDFRYWFELHGFGVVCLWVDVHYGCKYVTVNHCGYRTRTTATAVKDALELFGFRGGVSFAEGKYRVGVDRQRDVPVDYIDVKCPSGAVTFCFEAGEDVASLTSEERA